MFKKLLLATIVSIAAYAVVRYVHKHFTISIEFEDLG